MLSIGADVCRTAGNDLLGFKTNRETEVNEPRAYLAEPCEGVLMPVAHPPTLTLPTPPPLKPCWGGGDTSLPQLAQICLPSPYLKWPPALMPSSASHELAGCLTTTSGLWSPLATVIKAPQREEMWMSALTPQVRQTNGGFAVV